MATAASPQPGSEDAAQIVGDQLELDLVEAGVARPAARAIHHALELVVLRLLLVVAAKQDVRDAIDGLRREINSRFEALEARFEARFESILAQLMAHERRLDEHGLAIAELRREMRWGFGLLFTAILALTIAVVTRGL